MSKLPKVFKTIADMVFISLIIVVMSISAVIILINLMSY